MKIGKHKVYVYWARNLPMQCRPFPDEKEKYRIIYSLSHDYKTDPCVLVIIAICIKNKTRQ